MAVLQESIRTLRGIQQSFLLPATPLPVARVELKGAVYTKRWVVELLLDLSGYSSTVNLVDSVAVEPSAGEGAFLGPMIERLAASCERQGRSILECERSLIAYELDESSADQARTLATEVLVRRGTDHAIARTLAESWVRTGDYLLDSMCIHADYVIGNPPYVRLEDIPDETASSYRLAYGTMRGRADLYVAFFEAALRQLKPGGICTFICADRWMRNQYGAELRDLITTDFALDVVIEMHHADSFEDEVDAYPAITVIRRGPQMAVIVASLDSDVAALPSEVLATAICDNTAGVRGPMRGLRSASVNSWFKGNVPWPCNSPEQLILLRRLEDEFPLLEASARVGIGVATGHDRVFITTDPNLVEPTRLLRLAMGKDIRNGTMDWSGHYLVDPWNEDGLVALDQYPRMQAYLEGHGAALRGRHTALKSAHAWYKTIDRVTHSLTAKKKLYIGDIRNVLEPVLDHGETYPHHNLYFIQSDVWDLEVLGGLLLSRIGQFFVESYGVRMRGGYLRFQAQYLRRICVPDPESISEANRQSLKQAFRARDREMATQVALEIYRVQPDVLERIIGH